MKHFLNIKIALFFLTICFSTAISNTISLQGIYSSPNDDVTQFSMRVKFYDDPNSSDAVWSEAHLNIPLKKGIYSIQLGSIVPFDSVDFSKPLWIATVINNEENIRSPLQFVPKSKYADVSQSVKGIIKKGTTVEHNILVTSVNGLKNDVSIQGKNGIQVSEEENTIMVSLDSTVLLDGIQGDQGPKGDNGNDGEDGSNIVSAMFNENGDLLFITDKADTIALAGAKDSLKGEDGNNGNGNNGVDGISVTGVSHNGTDIVFQRDNGSQPSLILDSAMHILKGEKGAKGDTGSEGTNGTDGISITGVSHNGTDIVFQRNNGSQASLILDSAMLTLKGEKGDKGDTGSTLWTELDDTLYINKTVSADELKLDIYDSTAWQSDSLECNATNAGVIALLAVEGTNNYTESRPHVCAKQYVSFSNSNNYSWIAVITDTYLQGSMGLTPEIPNLSLERIIFTAPTTNFCQTHTIGAMFYESQQLKLCDCTDSTDSNTCSLKTVFDWSN